jgi:predicted Co/Zn/Cd cation transporter (cation efflux family)
MINMYRTKEIVFIDAVVESVVASTGVKTKKMEEKEKEVEKKIAEYEQGVDEENKVGPTTEIEIEEVVPEAVVSVTNEQFQEARETMEKELIMANGAQGGASWERCGIK